MPNKVLPITPSKVCKAIRDDIPDQIFEAFNELIVKNCRGKIACVSQTEAVKLIVSKGLKKADLFENGWLDVEKHYRSAGWKVVYDKPAFNEDYEPTFTFTKRTET